MAQEVALPMVSLCQCSSPSGHGAQGRSPSKCTRQVYSQVEGCGLCCLTASMTAAGERGSRHPPPPSLGRLLAPFSHSSTIVFCAAFSHVCSSPDFCGTSKASLPSAHEIIPPSEQSSAEEAFVDSQPPSPQLYSIISASALN